MEGAEAEVPKKTTSNIHKTFLLPLTRNRSANPLCQVYGGALLSTKLEETA